MAISGGFVNKPINPTGILVEQMVKFTPISNDYKYLC